jgi:hypothetical protein
MVVMAYLSVLSCDILIDVSNELKVYSVVEIANRLFKSKFFAYIISILTVI